jgi:hypothetical protein
LAWTIAAIEIPCFAVESGSYSQRLGERLHSRTLCASAELELPIEWIYWVVPLPPEQVRWTRISEESFSLKAANRAFTMTNQQQVVLKKP